MNLDHEITAVLEWDTCLPAVAQGAIGIQIRENTFTAVSCERAFLAALDGNCRTPIAGQAKIVDGVVTFKGLIAAEDGTEIHRTEITGSPEDVVQLGTQAG